MKIECKANVGTVAHADHLAFLTKNRGHEEGLRKILEGLTIYANAHRNEWGLVGQDGYCGRYWMEIASAVVMLLSGPGRFDGGSIDSAIRAFAAANGYSQDEADQLDCIES